MWVEDPLAIWVLQLMLDANLNPATQQPHFILQLKKQIAERHNMLHHMQIWTYVEKGPALD